MEKGRPYALKDTSIISEIAAGTNPETAHYRPVTGAAGKEEALHCGTIRANVVANSPRIGLFRGVIVL